jgi:hypothetical protein
MIIPTEAQEQEMFCKWLDLKKLDYFAIPNGGSRHKLEAANMKKQGVKKGVSDMFIFAPTRALLMEMKRRDPKLSKTSKEQIAFKDTANKYPYAEARICYGYDEAVAFVEEFL